MNSLGKSTLILLLVALTVGCASQGANRPASALSGPPQQVDVLLSPPERAFKVIGNISLYERPETNRQALVTQLREQAAAMGADAVFLGNPQVYPVGAVIDLPDSNRNAGAGGVVNSRVEASSPTLLRLARAPRGKTTPSTKPRKLFYTGVAICYQ